MSKINRLLFMLIAMVAIMIVAVGIDKGTEYFEDRKWEKERVQRYEEAYAEVSDIQVTISELSQDQEAIEAFIEENKEYFEEAEFGKPQVISDGSPSSETETENVSGNAPSEENVAEGEPETTVSENGQTVEGTVQESISETTVSENTPSEEGAVTEGTEGSTVSENALLTEGTAAEESSENTVSENTLQEEGMTGESVSENAISESTVSENTLHEGMAESVSGNTVSGNTISGNSLQETVSQNTVSENALSEGSAEGTVSGNTIAGGELSLQERREMNTSYIESQTVNQRDKQIIAGSSIDFSNVKVACLGDSLTAATNLEKMENYQQYSYPTKLGEVLGAEAVYNLGIGGSSIGRYWENAFVDRYKEIPQDTDIIIVMGGTNDGFCVTKEDLGSMQERKPRTFYGDLDELMRGLKADYPDAMIVFATPLPNVLHDMLRKERAYLLPQKEIADAIKLLGEEHNISVIDLYNSNILDSHDAAVIFNYMPDGVHGNEQGYQILAEHMAAEIIGLYSGAE